MRKCFVWVFLLLACDLSEAAIGETLAQCSKRYGEGEIVKIEGSRYGHHVNYEMVGLTFTASFPSDDPDAKCGQIEFSSGEFGKVSTRASQVRALLTASGGGRKWTREGTKKWRRGNAYIPMDPKTAPEEFFMVDLGRDISHWRTEDGAVYASWSGGAGVHESFSIYSRAYNEGRDKALDAAMPEPRRLSDKERAFFDALIEQVGDPAVREIPVNREQLSLLLEVLISSLGDGWTRNNPGQTSRCLLIAKSSDGTDIDLEIAKFATSQPMSDAALSQFFGIVGHRASPSAFPPLLGYASKSPRADKTSVALWAALAKMIDRSQKREEFSPLLIDAYKRQADEEVRNAFLGLLGHTGSDEARKVVMEALASDDEKVNRAATFAIRYWPDDSMFEALVLFIGKQKEPKMRSFPFQQAVFFLNDKKRERSIEDTEALWNMLARQAKTEGEIARIINGCVGDGREWAIGMIERIALDSGSDRIKERARRAIEHIRARAQAGG